LRRVAVCRFIAGEPQDFHTQGDEIFCGKPAARSGGAWCRQHEAVVFTTIEEIREARKAA
jgi:hypothetical protein